MIKNKTLIIQITLVVVTFFTTTFAGVEWAWGRSPLWGDIRMSWDDFVWGLQFSIPFLSILTFHEFGHYFTARYHQIKVTLPYYIPFWLGFIPIFFQGVFVGVIPSLGTMGAFIRIKEEIRSRTHYFDVGISGPIAGFVIALGVLWYGFSNLPETEFIYEVHPEYELLGPTFEEQLVELDTVVYKKDLNSKRYQYEMLPDSMHLGGRGLLYFGDNLLMMIGRNYIAPDDRYVPSGRELMHYPWLLAGFLALFFTALNLLPIGQLDGGHVIFGLFGPIWHRRISTFFFSCLIFYSGLGWVKMQHLTEDSSGGLMSFVIQVLAYLYIVYLCTYSMIPNKRDRWLYAGVMMGVQFMLASFAGVEGYSGWLLFAVILGRVIGIQHPQVIDDRPLSTGRKVLGWISLLIFVLCFTPKPIIM